MVKDTRKKSTRNIPMGLWIGVLVVLLSQTGCGYLNYLERNKKVPMPPKMWWENTMTARQTVNPETGQKELTKTSTFFSTDSAAVSTITLRNVSGEHDLRWEWIKPDGKVYYMTGKQPVHVKKGMFVSEMDLSHNILINSEKAEHIYGDWWVNIYLNGQKIVVQNFTIKGDAEFAGAWFIFDDYLDKSTYTTTELFAQFKSSDYLENLIAEKAGKEKFRFDLIRGAYTEKVPNDYSVRAKSSFTRTSEIRSLINLADHEPGVSEVKWDLHLFLARITSGSIEDLVIDQIMDRMKNLNVERITVWEFSDNKPVEKTIYQSVFDKFRDKFNLRYNIIHSKEMFEELYRNIYYE